MRLQVKELKGPAEIILNQGDSINYTSVVGSNGTNIFQCYFNQTLSDTHFPENTSVIVVTLKIYDSEGTEHAQQELNVTSANVQNADGTYRDFFEFSLNIDSPDGQHKYQSLVQKYKFTKLLAVDDRLKYQEKYNVIRNILGNIMSSKPYDLVFKLMYESKEKDLIACAQGDIGKHYNFLSIKEDIFDTVIDTENKAKVDNWSNLLVQLSCTFLGISEDNIDKGLVSGDKLDTNSSVIAILKMQINIEEIEKLRETKFDRLFESASNISDKVDFIGSVSDGMISSANIFLTNIVSKLEKNIDNLKDNLNSLINRFLMLSITAYQNNRAIMDAKTVEIAKVLAKYTDLSPNTIGRITNDILSGRLTAIDIEVKKNRPKYFGRFDEALKNAINFKNSQIMSTDLSSESNQIRDVQISLLKDKKYLNVTIKTLEHLKKITAAINWISITFSALVIIEELKSDKTKSMVDYAYITLKSVQFMASGADALCNAFWKTSNNRLVKLILNDWVGFGLNFVIFLAEMVNVYRMFAARNPKMAYYTAASAVLALFSSLILTYSMAAIAAGPVGMIGIIIMVAAFVITLVGSIFAGYRAGTKAYDLWQGFLINSIYSNYEGGYLTLDNNINGTIKESIEATHYQVANLLYKDRAKIADDEHSFMKREYNLQNFVEMLSLLNQFITIFEVSIDKASTSYVKGSEYDILDKITVVAQFYGGRFSILDPRLVLHISFTYVDEKGENKTIQADPYAITPLSHELEQDEETGMFTAKLIYNIADCFFSSVKYVTPDQLEALTANGCYSLEPNRSIKIASSSFMTFGARLLEEVAVSDAEALELLDSESETDSKETPDTPTPKAETGNWDSCYPWDSDMPSNDVDVFRGFKAPVCVPIPAPVTNNDVFTDHYYWSPHYRDLSIHLSKEDCTMGRMANLENPKLKYKPLTFYHKHNK